MTRRDRKIQPSHLRQLWAAYTEFRASQLAKSTIQRDYRKVARVLEKLPPYLTSSIEMRDWLIQNYSGESTRRIIQQLNACCNWATDSDLLTVNPFQGLMRGLKRKQNATAWTGFTARERDIIIQEFEAREPFYSPWVKFLFWTGCRPEEACALRWRHISPIWDVIRISEAAPVDTKQLQPTKNYKVREFPISDRLRALLIALPSYHVKVRGEALVFTGRAGGPVEYHNFQTRYWKPIVEELVERRLIALYLPQSHCRHTWISLALEAGMLVKDVAYLSGNTPDVIYRHYASRSRVIQIPDF